MEGGERDNQSVEFLLPHSAKSGTFALWAGNPDLCTIRHMMKLLAEILSKDDLEKLLERADVMIAVAESDGKLLAWNQSFNACNEQFPEMSAVADFFSEQDRERVIAILESKKQEQWIAKFPACRDEAEVASYCECFLIPMTDGRVIFLAREIGASAAMREIERLNRLLTLYKTENEASKKMVRDKQIEINGIMAQAQEVAQIDPLTFLYNRRRIVRELQDEVLRAERYKSTLSISVADVDHFKAVNDTHGHLAGDEVLREVAGQLRDHIRQPDIVGRYGGEEFLIILPNSDARAAAEQAARLCRFMRESRVSINNSDQNIHVTISIGSAQFQHGIDTWESLLQRADAAMYESKKNGRDRWTVAE